MQTPNPAPDQTRDHLYTADALDQDNSIVSVQLIQQFEDNLPSEPAGVLDYKPGIEVMIRGREAGGQASVLYSLDDARRLITVLEMVLHKAELA